MLKNILRILNIAPVNPRTLAVCASALLMAACASNGDYNDSAHRVGNQTSGYGSVSTSKDVWQRVRNNFGMPDLVNEEVIRKEEYYASRADYVNRMASRSGDFLALIMNEVEKRRMPSEIALLPFVESAFVTTATSPVKASGLWQFMPATGRDFSLAQNRFADQRNDVVASTDAALTFLQRLHDQFGDWHLALAAYNWGPGNVNKAVRRAQAAGYAGTYQDIRMPAETRQYVPKLQAIKNIVANPARFGITLPDVSNDLRHEPILVSRDIDVTKAAELAGMDLESFKRINPAFKKPVIAAALGSRILVPAHRANAVRDAFNSRSETLATLTTYSTYSSESLADIASRFNTNEDNLRYLNNIPSYHGYVKANSTLLVPRTTNKSSEDIPYQALNSSLVTTTGDIGFGGDYAVEAPIFVANADEITRQERSGIVNPSTAFASNTVVKSNLGLAFPSNGGGDDLSHLIQNNAATLKDPTPVRGALIVDNAAPRVIAPTASIEPLAPLAITPFEAIPTPPAAPVTAVAVTAPTTPTAPIPALNQVAPSAPPVTVAAIPTATPVSLNPEPESTALKANPVPLSALNQVVSPSAPPLTLASTNAPAAPTAAPIEAPVIVAAAESINPALQPLDPAAFKLAEQENIAAATPVIEEPVAVKAKPPVVRPVSIASIKPASKPVVAQTKPAPEAKVVKTNYTPRKASAPAVQKPSKPEVSAKPTAKPQQPAKKVVEAKAAAKPAKAADKPEPIKSKVEAKGKSAPVVSSKKPAETAPKGKQADSKVAANTSNKDKGKTPAPTANKNAPTANTASKKADTKVVAAKTTVDKNAKPVKKN